MRSNQSKTNEIKELAGERIKILFNEAAKKFKVEPKLSHRYVELARKIAMKAKVRMPRVNKRQYCTHCYKYLQTGSNSTIRIHRSKIIISCHECKKFTRIPLKQKRKKILMETKEKKKN